MARPAATAIVLLLAGAPARAHRPHAVVLDVSFAPEADGRAWAIWTRDSATQLVRSEDWGAHWLPRGGAPQRHRLVALAHDPSGALWALDETGLLYRSDDDGESWTRFQVPLAEGRARDLAATPDTVVVAADDGIHVADLADPASSTLAAPGVAATRLEPSPDDPSLLLAVVDERAVLRSEDGGRTWTELARIDGDDVLWDAVELDGVVYLGTSGGFARLGDDGAPVPCGAVPDDPTAPFASDGTLLAATEEGELLAATGHAAVFVSTDGCASWAARTADALNPLVGSASTAVSSADEAFREIASLDGHWLVAGHMGTGASADGGGSWAIAYVEPGIQCRRGALGPEGAARPVFWSATWGGGPARYEDGTWRSSTSGLGDDTTIGEAVYGYDVRPLGAGVVLYQGGDWLYRSTDGGNTWSWTGEASGVLHRAGDLAVAAGDFADPAVVDVRASRDLGETWEELAALDALVGGGRLERVQEVVRDGATGLLAAWQAPVALYASFDGGETWETWFQGPDDPTGHVAAWPLEDPYRLALFDDDGVRWSDDGGKTWHDAKGADAPPYLALAQGRDGTLLAANAAGEVVRSEDGGATWVSADDGLHAVPHSIELAPDFAASGLAVACTFSGPLWSTDRGRTWHPFPRYERFESGTYLLTCLRPGEEPEEFWGSTCEQVEDPAYGGGSAFLVEPGDEATFSFYGTRWRLPLDGDGSLLLEFDGEAQGEIPVDGAGVLEATEPEGWHDVRLVGQSGQVIVDYVEVFGPGEDWAPEPADTGEPPVDTGEPPVDTGEPPSGADGGGAGGGGGPEPVARRCACAAGLGGPAALLPALAGLLLAAARRRR